MDGRRTHVGEVLVEVETLYGRQDKSFVSSTHEAVTASVSHKDGSSIFFPNQSECYRRYRNNRRADPLLHHFYTWLPCHCWAATQETIPGEEVV